MQHMVRDKLFNLKNLVFLALAYLLLLIFDYYYFDDHGLQNRIDQSKERFETFDSNVQGLIFGGSNAMWGISAKKLSKETNIGFYNFSIHSNGFNYLNYFEYINSALSKQQKENTRYIIWSNIHPLDSPPYDDFSRQITGRLNSISKGLNLSLAQHIKNTFLSSSHKFIHDKNSGDFAEESFTCPVSDISILDTNLRDSIVDMTINLQFHEEFKIEFDAYRDFYAQNFPNAKVFFVIHAAYSQIKIEKNILNRFILLSEEANYNLFISSPLQDLKYICDASHHPSILGREVRSAELSKLIINNI